MCTCKICGKETRKGRQTCIGCTHTIEVASKQDKASKSSQRIALDHLQKNSGLAIISFSSFKKKRTAQHEG